VFLRATYCIVLCTISLSAFGQTDTLKRVMAKDVVVESTRLTEELYPSPSTVTYRDAAELIKLSGSSLASSALSLAHPALDIRSYGTQSGIALASFRGLPPEFTAVYRNGIRVTNEQHGLTDLSKLGLRSADKVEVLTGTNAQVLAGDVGGAAIGIVSEPFLRGERVRVGTDIITYDDAQSFAEKEYYGSANYMLTGKFGIAFDGSYRTSLGDYPFEQTVTQSNGKPTEVEVRRSNNDSYLTLLQAEPYYILSESSRIQGFLLFDETERGVPGAVTVDYSGASSPYARQFDRDWLAGIILKNKASEEFDYSLSTSYQNQYETYIDPNIEVSDEYRNTIYDITLRSSYTASEEVRFGAVLEANKNDLNSNQNADSGSADISRQKYTGLLSATYIPLKELKLTGSLRIDDISDQENTQFLPAITTEYDFGDVMIGASYGRFYHAPTFNQLYWKVGGNQDLEAAHGANLNGWIEYGTAIEKTSFHMLATASYNAINNQIQWLPGKSGIWSPSNILNVVTSGVEFDGELHYEVSSPLAVALHEQFQYLQSLNKTSGSLNEGKQLPYAPKLRSVTQLTFNHITAGSFSVILRFRSERYTDLANNPTTTLPPVSTLDLTWSSSKIDITNSLPLEVRLAINNITNVQYEEIPSFPLPGRTFTLGLQLTFSNFYKNQ
jgi:iron complex outermembrane receptor protein